MTSGGFVNDGLRVSGNITSGVDASRQPLYTVGEVAKFFFHRSAEWLRWRERQGHLPVSRRSDSGARSYTLNDIDSMISSLAEARSINGEEAVAALATVAAQLIVWGWHCKHQQPADTCHWCERDRLIESGEFGIKR